MYIVYIYYKMQILTLTCDDDDHDKWRYVGIISQETDVYGKIFDHVSSLRATQQRIAVIAHSLGHRCGTCKLPIKNKTVVW